MSEQERADQFSKALNDLMKKYGLTLQPELHTEKLGDAVLVKPKLVLVPVPGWVPDEQSDI